MRSKIVTLHASAAEADDGNSEGFSTIDAKNLGVAIDVTAVSGTDPTIAFSIEWSPDGVRFGDAETPDTFASITATKVTAKPIVVKAPYYRLAWVITGTATPTFTFVATAAAHL